MPYTLLLIGPAFVLLWVVAFVVPRRPRTERRARALLVQYPDVGRTLALHSTFTEGKRREIDAKIAEMQREGWTLLRVMEASPLRTIFSWGGGLTLHFIRKNV